ncbi:hypothetical protein [Mycolicibacterium mageritense]|uniref:hypothetical protein n=1 Tax=Mycolicibacterium mageritense TaxID=53462 RepID=UPI001E3403A5|nr:hypothetical protein [Mycolicibacterium mageritense]GJJ23586.1 hypothetical protein MTY414_72590 [Mycolicibacterium mageritense]
MGELTAQRAAAMAAAAERVLARVRVCRPEASLGASDAAGAAYASAVDALAACAVHLDARSAAEALAAAQCAQYQAELADIQAS